MNDHWTRGDVASFIFDFESESGNEIKSQRQFSKKNRIPRTTLQHWLSRKANLDASLELIEFFESPVGIAFLHRMITAAHFEFCKNGPSSIHNVSNFLKLCGLNPFIATSYSTQRKVARQMDEAIISFGKTEQQNLVVAMPEKWITLCEDETFHPSICMVAIEAVSNFIILEEYVEKRDAKTWNKVLGKALDGLPVKVIQVASDEAKGLISHTVKGLGANHSPDVFHVSHEIGKGTSGALAGKIKQAEKNLEISAGKTRKEIKFKKQYDKKLKKNLDDRPDFERKIVEAYRQEIGAEEALDNARQNQETVQREKREIGKSYHPYAPETGEKQDAENVSNLLESHFEKIHGSITGLSDVCKKRVEKAHRVVKDMVANIAFYFIMISQYMDNIGVSENERQIMNDYLIPCFYLQQVSRKENDIARKEIIKNKSEAFLSVISDPDGPLSGYSDRRIEFLTRAAKDCANFFQRSSSCVEGRNAQLSLRHHGIHRLSANHLKALTVVHNYHIKNRDGVTPAERFFETKHNDLFESLLNTMNYPARPRKHLSVAA